MIEESEKGAVENDRGFIANGKKSYIMQVSTRSVENHLANAAVPQRGEHDRDPFRNTM